MLYKPTSHLAVRINIMLRKKELFLKQFCCKIFVVTCRSQYTIYNNKLPLARNRFCAYFFENNKSVWNEYSENKRKNGKDSKNKTFAFLCFFLWRSMHKCLNPGTHVEKNITYLIVWMQAPKPNSKRSLFLNPDAFQKVILEKLSIHLKHTPERPK